MPKSNLWQLHASEETLSSSQWLPLIPMAPPPPRLVHTPSAGNTRRPIPGPTQARILSSCTPVGRRTPLELFGPIALPTALILLTLRQLIYHCTLVLGRMGRVPDPAQPPIHTRQHTISSL